AAQEAIDAHRTQPRGVVRISCPVGLLHAEIGDMLAGFMAEYPQVELHIEATNRRVDLVAEGVDVALRARRPPLEDSDLVMRVLSHASQCLTASPYLISQQPPLQSPLDLSKWPSLLLG